MSSSPDPCAMECDSVDTSCYLKFLNTLSETDIFRHERISTEHHEAFKLYWGNKQVINVDNIRHADSNKLFRTLHRCTNLKKISMRWVESENRKKKGGCRYRCIITRLYEKIPRAIATHCRTLEVLDLIGKDLTQGDLEALSSLTTLKQIAFVVPIYTRYLETLLINNPQLETVDLACNVQDTFIDNLPSTIKHLHLASTIDASITRLLPKLETMQLEELTLPDILVKGEDIRRLSKQTTLRAIHLWCDANDSDLGLLFSNNPHLVEVRLVDEGDNNLGPCLRKLPKTLITLDLIWFLNVKDEDLIWCFKTCNIENFWLHGTESKHNYLPEVVKLATNLKELTLNCKNCTVENLKSILQLQQLEKVELFGVLRKHKDTVRAIEESIRVKMQNTTNRVGEDTRGKCFKCF